MTDPVLHEDTIMDALDCTAEHTNTGRLQAAAMLCLIDAYDRKLQREHFVALASAALGLHTQIGKLYMMTSVRENEEIGVLDHDMLNKAVFGVHLAAGTAHMELFKLMQKIIACPTSADKVH